ncbi:hypothetical protein LQF76_02000 [Gloeomargaritales cyanobacterium VI4D9]|jgi:hypothetical protein|nr:hypothetical protein LQF76_02000 [Gloeomargaritales cyanobacterium VI4D9]
MNPFFQKATIFSVLCPLIIAVALPYALYLLTRDSVSAIGGVYVLIAIVVLGGLWGLDRLLSMAVPLVFLSIAEVVLLAGVALWYGYSSKEFTIDASTNPSPVILIAYTTDKTLAEEPQSVFPFHKKITLSDRNYAILHDMYRPRENSFSPILKSPANWGNGFRSSGIQLKNGQFTEIYIFSGVNSRLSESEKESLVKEFLGRIKK